MEKNYHHQCVLVPFIVLIVHIMTVDVVRLHGVFVGVIKNNIEK